jgi:hypothetical protein
MVSAPLMDSLAEWLEGLNSYRCSFGVNTAYIQGDKGPSLATESLALSPAAPLFVLEEDFGASSELQVRRSIAKPLATGEW